MSFIVLFLSGDIFFFVGFIKVVGIKVVYGRYLVCVVGIIVFNMFKR